jgi:hypothetical protein
MTSRTIALGVALFGMTMVVAVGCGNGDDGPKGSGGAAGSGSGGKGGSNATGGMGGESHGSGASECLVLGELCHRVDDVDGPLHECHEVGHVGDPVACAAEFDECTTSCIEAGEPGVGGAGAGGAEGEPGPIKCMALGELCHPVDDIDGPLHECHELGHVADVAVCEAEFDHCVTICIEAIEAAEGAGGTGGNGSGGAP